jgi:hypothetical protein
VTGELDVETKTFELSLGQAEVETETLEPSLAEADVVTSGFDVSLPEADLGENGLERGQIDQPLDGFDQSFDPGGNVLEDTHGTGNG